MSENTIEQKKKTIFSGVQPSGKLTLGNYLGAIRNFGPLQEEYNCIYCVVDMHAITVRQDPATLRRQTLEVLAQYIACGLDPDKSTLFIQSHVPAHAELAWVLSCYTMFGELSRMTQFKDKSSKHADNVNAGLFTYPVLMASDILLYQTDMVPVGVDQKQHVELARNIAQRFNGVYSDTFVMPEPYIPQTGAKIMSLQEPSRKMSKSDENQNSFILLMDKPDDIMRKFRRAVTDSDTRVARGEGKDGVNNLISIYALATGKTPEQVEAEFEGKGYGDFKPAVGEAVVELLRPIREKTEALLQDKGYLESVYKEGAAKANYLARKTLDKVYRKVGFVKR
ncbi:tryptophan--tRNA ligase [Intestinibacillus massiliensis]|uniref:tryptophan--tRNA ligase n=1 Tax=Intestinibacillus massiliensis TaxID=1871029 RepID=UPI00190E80B5|nr:tryptophan--tRNA ligase [Intestinibacillus massiliensis]MCB6366898.1 tryptophan--tRNA ligase [Intestinibacillus massiliensis]